MGRSSVAARSGMFSVTIDPLTSATRRAGSSRGAAGALGERIECRAEIGTTMASRVIREAASVSARRWPGFLEVTEAGGLASERHEDHADHHDDDDGQLEDEQLPGKRKPLSRQTLSHRALLQRWSTWPDVTT